MFIKQKNYKLLIRNFNSTWKKAGFFNINITDKWKCISLCFYLMIGFFWRLYLYTVFLWCSEKKTPNNKYLLVVIKRRLKVQEKNMSCERAFNFDQWKTCPTNNKPITVSRLQLFFKFIQRDFLTPLTNKYPNLKTTCNIKPNISLWTKLPKNLLLAKKLISVAAVLSIKVFAVHNPFQVGLSQ